MSNEQPKISTVKELENFVAEHNIKTFKVGAVDIDGLWRGKRIAARYFLESVATKGTNICNILFGWDMHDEPIPNLKYTGWQTAYPDITLVPDLGTLKPVPWEPGTASVICDIHEMDGGRLELAPRALLRRIVARASAAGYTPKCGYELEVYLLKGTADQIAANGFRDLEPFTRGNHTYSVQRDTASEYLIGEIREQLAAYGIYIEASNSEHGPGQFEVNMRYCDALAAADGAMLLKNSIKEIAAKHGCTASFIAKLSPEWAGSSGHLHQSLVDAEGGIAFANAEDPSRLSPVGEAYMAGVVDLAKDMTALYLPTVNSYKRTEGGSWAGSSSTWGYDNRTVAVRAIPSAGAAARIENRIAGADANPYLVIAASLGTGLHGISKGLTPPAPMEGNAYEKAGPETALPNTLEAACGALENSNTARALLGDAFVDHYVATRRWEVRKFHSHVTEWEISRYLEHI
ncbi:glutamine synthetase [Streptomyces sp. MnatMP-M27]|uniref:glutamine synthetase family protein n=1 Tax=Streptomyces sp. MnatMP-M27 TaxID=1839768 RepID=UPI00081E8AF3|nr:glutamine synthetase family protein [Streptomyces sp. MnatMP-M27]SCF78218.1 glutamine synthetase [Streptomyces sp. MnatMP-M27]